MDGQGRIIQFKCYNDAQPSQAHKIIAEYAPQAPHTRVNPATVEVWNNWAGRSVGELTLPELSNVLAQPTGQVRFAFVLEEFIVLMNMKRL